MLLLYFLGRLLEPAIGSAALRRHLLHLAARGSFGVLLATAGPSLGASGAIFGLHGRGRRSSCARAASASWSPGSAASSFSTSSLTFAFPGISIGAHIGGLIGARSRGSRCEQPTTGACPRSGSSAAALLIACSAVAGSLAVAGSTAPASFEPRGSAVRFRRRCPSLGDTRSTQRLAQSEWGREGALDRRASDRSGLRRRDRVRQPRARRRRRRPTTTRTSSCTAGTRCASSSPRTPPAASRTPTSRSPRRSTGSPERARGRRGASVAPATVQCVAIDERRRS